VSYRWVDHTAEVELQLEGEDEEAIFAAALRALAELLGGATGGERCSRQLLVPADAPSVGSWSRDRALLLAAWLDELVFRAETEDLIPEDVERIDLAEDQLTATVRFRRGTPRHLVKGVTHHRLAFAPARGGFVATVVLDV
jgi:SHS2 domain-containing protein